MNGHALCRVADDSTRDTFGRRARACARMRVARVVRVDVVFLSLERYADDFCSAQDALDPDFEARCDLTGNARRVTRDACGSVIESRLPATRAPKSARSPISISRSRRDA